MAPVFVLRNISLDKVDIHFAWIITHHAVIEFSRVLVLHHVIPTRENQPAEAVNERIEITARRVVEEEQVRVRPHVGRVGGDEDRGVAEDQHPALGGEMLERGPLPVEEELTELVHPGLVRQRFPGGGERDPIALK
jgi:hypothetical protein